MKQQKLCSRGSFSLADGRSLWISLGSTAMQPNSSLSFRLSEMWLLFKTKSSKIKYLIQGSEKATWISLRCGQKVLPQCNQRKPFIVLEHIDLVALAAALRKGLFSRSYDNLPFTLSACRSLKTFGQFLCRRMRDFILHGVEGKLSGWEPDKEKLWSTFPAVLYSTILLRHWKGLFLVTPIWSRGSQGGGLGPDRCWERPWGTGSQNISTGLPSAPGGSPTLRADLQERGAKGSVLLCKGVDIWHNPGNNWLQSCPFLGFPAQGSELDHFLFIKGSYFALILYKQRVMIESTRCRGNLFLKDGFWKLE